MEAIRVAASRGEMRELMGSVSLRDETLLTSKEVGPLIGVKHHKTVERYVREKALPCVRVGRNLRFRLGDVRRWVAQRKEG
jgi:excisionase family DNA binding protein